MGKCTRNIHIPIWTDEHNIKFLTNFWGSLQQFQRSLNRFRSKTSLFWVFQDYYQAMIWHWKLNHKKIKAVFNLSSTKATSYKRVTILSAFIVAKRKSITKSVLFSGFFFFNFEDFRATTKKFIKHSPFHFKQQFPVIQNIIMNWTEYKIQHKKIMISDYKQHLIKRPWKI